MKLGNLLSLETKAAIRTVTKIPWHRKTKAEKAQAVTEYLASQNAKLGQFLAVKARRRCSKTLPRTEVLMSRIEQYAPAVSEANRHFQEDRVFKNAVYDVLQPYGFRASYRGMSAEYDAFELR